MDPLPSEASHWAEAWQRSWDQLEMQLESDRERWIGALLDVVDAVAVEPPTIIDLACGPGTVTRRLLQRRPLGQSIAVDVDPVLLAIAEATFEGNGCVQVVRADLGDPGWLDSLPPRQVDAAVTSTSLHWLSEDTVRRLYQDLARLVRPGGVVAHAEVMPMSELAVLGPALAAVDRDRRRSGSPDDHSAWDKWWQSAAQDPALEHASTQRREVFPTGYPTEEFSPPAEWHIAALLDAGFVEAGIVWRSGPGAVVAALR